jgi:hypothetical protein
MHLHTQQPTPDGVDHIAVGSLSHIACTTVDGAVLLWRPHHARWATLPPLPSAGGDGGNDDGVAVAMTGR